MVKKNYDVITVGSAVVDAFVPTKIKEKHKKILVPAGSKVSIDNLYLSSGGGGTNSAAVLSKLGLRVGYVGKIGMGINSDVILHDLKKYNIDFLGIRSKEGSGYSAIIESEKKNRTILSYKGASDHLRYADLRLSTLRTKWFHFTGLKGVSFQTQKKLVDFAKKNTIQISYNPGSYNLEKGLGPIKKILENTTLLSMNREESKILMGTRMSLRNVFKRLHSIGVKIVCITEGKKGGYISDSKNVYSFTPRKVKIKECTGAGDTFASSLLTGLITFNDLETAIKLAVLNSESVIQKIGAKHGLLSMSRAKKLLKSEKIKLNKKKL